MELLAVRHCAGATLRPAAALGSLLHWEHALVWRSETHAPPLASLAQNHGLSTRTTPQPQW